MPSDSGFCIQHRASCVGNGVDPAMRGRHLAGPAQEAVDHAAASDQAHGDAGCRESVARSRARRRAARRIRRRRSPPAAGRRDRLPPAATGRRRSSLRRRDRRPSTTPSAPPSDGSRWRTRDTTRANRSHRAQGRAAAAGAVAQRRRQRSRKVNAAARLPPELSPATAKRMPSAPSAFAFAAGPVPCGFEVVERGRIDVLGRASIVDRDDHGAQPIGEDAAQPVVRLERTGDPTAAVRVDDQRQRLCRCWPVHAHRKRVVLAGSNASVIEATGSGSPPRRTGAASAVARSCATSGASAPTGTLKTVSSRRWISGSSIAAIGKPVRRYYPNRAGRLTRS